MTAVELQRAFAARIRQPHQQPLPDGVAAERMAVYERLFFNTIEGFISGAFPVLRRLSEASRWNRWVRAFIAEYQALTPYFLGVSQEFIAWLQQGYVAEPGDPPFILELAHYEWVELALDISEAELPEQGWSALAWPLAYQWPVQRIGQDYQPSEAPAEATCLLVWRDPQDQVRFMQLSPFAYQLAVRLQGGEAALDALHGLARQHGLHGDQAYLRHAHSLLDDWQRQGIWRAAADPFTP